MDIFDFLTLIGGLCLFLFGMEVMGSSLEKRAGGSLKRILRKLTTNKFAGFLTGLAVTTVIQSSSATTVMVMGFVNSGVMTLSQSVGVIIGSNVGTTVTGWILSLTGINGENFLLQMLKPSSFTPILALIGIIFVMFSKNSKKKDTGMILLGFATLMAGMETMSAAVEGLKNVPEFQNVLLMFSNPILGVLVGVVVTGIVQSSSASVGILQALSSTGTVTFGIAIPVVMGAGIGTCVTALLSSIGANREAKRSAIVHLTFNIIGTVVWLSLFYIANAIFKFTFIDNVVGPFEIAVINSIHKLLTTAALLPLSEYLEKFACFVVKDNRKDKESLLDERLMKTPTVAIDSCHVLAVRMAETAMTSMKNAMSLLENYDSKLAQEIRDQEDLVDKYEDELNTYLVKISSHQLSEEDSNECAKLLHSVGDFERISDHAVNIVESAEEMHDKEQEFSEEAKAELQVIVGAVSEILDLSLDVFINGNLELAAEVEPLEEVVDTLKEQLRNRHVLRMQQGKCSIEVGFVWSDLLTNLERVSDHCSNIAGCVIEMAHSSLDLHHYVKDVASGSQTFMDKYRAYSEKYALLEKK